MFFFPSIFISWTPPGPRSSSRAAHRGGLELQIDVSDEAEGIGHLMVVPYGESADCYSMANCPQGKFSINLSETSIQYGCRGSRLLLYLLGRNMNILTFQENQIVYGKGGGYCSTCEPDHYREPKLDVLPYWTVEQQFRFMPTGV